MKELELGGILGVMNYDAIADAERMSREYQATIDWNRLVSEGLDTDGPTNARLPFTKMSKKYGRSWITYLKAAWSARDDLTIEEFCTLNGVPERFATKHLVSVGDV